MTNPRRRPRLPRPRLGRFPRRPINLLPSVLTIFNLYWGVASILASINGEYETAAIYIFIAMVFDGLDGAVARITRSVSMFGKELDSLCDMVSFGVAPALLIYLGFMFGVYPQDSAPHFIGSMAVIGFVICGALRLARFSVFQFDRPDAFAGLPTPASAVVVASFVLFTGYLAWEPPFWAVAGMLTALAVLMVSVVRYPKWQLQVFMLPPKRPYLFLLLCVVGVVAFHYARERSIAAVLLPLALIYVGYGIIDTAHRMLYAAWTGDSPAPPPQEEGTKTDAESSKPTSGEGAPPAT